MLNGRTLEENSLLFSTGIPEIDQIIQGSIGVLEILFPGRIRAYYLVGSYADDSAVPGSDIDLVPVFKGAMQEGEEQKYRRVVAHLDQISVVKLGFGLRNEDHSFREGGVGIKIGSELLYGEDVRDQIPLTPLEEYCRMLISTGIELIRELRGVTFPLILPISYPDSQDEFFGYVKEEKVRGMLHKHTSWVFGHLMFLASGMVTLKTGQYNASKSFSWLFYQRHIKDEWGDFLEAWYALGKNEWKYDVPAEKEARSQLRELCQRAVDFENKFLRIALAYAQERLGGSDDVERDWAQRMVENLRMP